MNVEISADKGERSTVRGPACVGPGRFEPKSLGRRLPARGSAAPAPTPPVVLARNRRVGPVADLMGPGPEAHVIQDEVVRGAGMFLVNLCQDGVPSVCAGWVFRGWVTAGFLKR